jgi:putative ABC transport system ATP-binding protein
VTAAIEARDVRFSFGSTPALRAASVAVAAGEVLAVMGPSGSGKSTLLHCLAGILVPDGGEIRCGGRRIDNLPESERSALRRDRFGFVFQFGQLVPELTAEENVALPLLLSGVRRRDALTRARGWFDRLDLAGLERRRSGELSGGQAQRVAIALALALRSEVLLADEPTSALDVTVQQQILRLLRQVSEETGAALIFISHDMAVVAELCQRVLVMYAGRVVEELDVATLLSAPAHPYTRALLASVPEMATERDQPLATIPGRPPEPHEIGDGCQFAPRCPFAEDRCRAELPLLRELAPGQTVACWYPQADAAPVGEVAAEGCG